MFSAGNVITKFIVVPESGEGYEVTVADYVAVVRSELPTREVLPPHLCDVEPGATAVILQQGDDEETFECSAA